MVVLQHLMDWKAATKGMTSEGGYTGTGTGTTLKWALEGGYTGKVLKRP